MQTNRIYCPLGGGRHRGASLSVCLGRGNQWHDGTIRGDFSASRQMNLVHGSDGPEAAKREIALYFRDEEICDYEPTISPWLRAVDEA